MKEKFKLINKQDLGLSILVSVCLCFLLFIFAPIDTYLANTDDLWFSLTDLLIPYLILFAAAVVVCALVFCVLRGRVRKVFLSLAFSAVVAFYIQGNFLTGGYGTMNGDEILWDAMVGKGIINTLIWLVCFAVPLVLLFYKEKIFKQAVKLCSIVVTGVLVFTLSFSLFTQQGERNVQDCYLSKESMFSVSPKENIITVVADTFEGTYLSKIIEQSPEYKDSLKDFIFYRNTTGISTLTYLSMSSMLTGNAFPLNANLSQGMNEVMNNTDFFDVMHEAGYDVNYYTDGTFFNSTSYGKVDNIVSKDLVPDLNTKIKITKRFYRFTLFKYMPHFLKPNFVVSTESFGQLQSELNHPVFIMNDELFFKQFNEEKFTLSKDRKQYNLYHLDGVHAPFNTDRNGNPVTYEADVPVYDRAVEKSYMSLERFIGMVDQLKETGAYDNSTIVFISDHGYLNRFNNVLMIKPANYTGEFKISDAPISLLEDYVPFIKQTAQGMGMNADLFKIKEGDDRTRYVYNYYSEGGYGEKNNVRSKIAVNGMAWDLNSYDIETDEYEYDEVSLEPVKLGETIKFDQKNKLKAQGFEKDTGIAFSKAASIGVSLDSIPDKLTLNLGIGTVKDDNQVLVAKVDGKEIFNQQIAKDTKSVKIAIPKEYITKDLKVELSFPNCFKGKSQEATETLIWWNFDSFEFSNVTFS